jgi:hypothetical protein
LPIRNMLRKNPNQISTNLNKYIPHSVRLSLFLQSLRKHKKYNLKGCNAGIELAHYIT